METFVVPRPLCQKDDCLAWLTIDWNLKREGYSPRAQEEDDRQLSAPITKTIPEKTKLACIATAQTTNSFQFAQWYPYRDRHLRRFLTRFARALYFVVVYEGLLAKTGPLQ
jgi:hypothetical protein